MSAASPQVFHVSEGRRSTVQRTEYSIDFSAPQHPGIPAIVNLYRHYAGMDVSVTTGDPELKEGQCMVHARGDGIQLRRLIEHLDGLLRGWGVELRDGFAGAPFYRSGRPGAERELG